MKSAIKLTKISGLGKEYVKGIKDFAFNYYPTVIGLECYHSKVHKKTFNIYIHGMRQYILYHFIPKSMFESSIEFKVPTKGMNEAYIKKVLASGCSFMSLGEKGVWAND